MFVPQLVMAVPAGNQEMTHAPPSLAASRADDEGFASVENLTASLPRSRRYSVDDVVVVNMRKGRIIFIMQKRELKRVGVRKLKWQVWWDNIPVQTALGELFEDRLQILK